jgi:hypothetical protein
MATKQARQSSNGHANGHVNRVAGQIPDAPFTPVADGGKAPAGEGREANGRFGIGNQAARGHGNPVHRKMASMRRALLSAVDEAALADLGRKMLAAARGGDWVAAKLLLSYTCGRPTDAPDADRLDLDEWALVLARPGMPEVLAALLKINPGTAAELLGNAGPKTVDDLLAKMKRANDDARRELAERMWEIAPDLAEELELDDDDDDDE